ncbi:MAG TPA: hypothetical protein PK445_04010 [Methanolinea sp.]|jgi:hypothetical protein|nr:hypothetical protein [Methanolinea sp.]HPC55921.1 hypothetical protein [Methanolinea sp.]HQE85489.1 hypothetical protein [Methanolinea sp.]HQI14341.1 hypothetical protein [Methanolinea sp.]HQJ18561.1 hypothetical protein [Methanolinea sp.]
MDTGAPRKTPLLEGVMEVAGLRCIEPSFADLIDDAYTAWLEDVPADEGRMLVDEGDEPLAFAFHTEQGWLMGSFHLKEPTLALIEHFEEIPGEIFQEERAVFEDAVREYYSLDLARTVTPALDDLNPDRIGKARDLLSEFWKGRSFSSCLDCCCGSGLGSLVLRERGIAPLAYDNDPSLLSLGISRGRLLPEKTMYIDGTLAEHYCRGADAGLGLMFGEINTFNEGTWEAITDALLGLAEYCLITVGTEREADLIRSWGKSRGCRVETAENTRDPIYDRWVCELERA